MNIKMFAKSALLAATAVSVSGLSPAVAQDIRMAGNWVLAAPVEAPLKTTNGASAPYKAEARTVLEQRMSAGLSADPVDRDCLPPGIPRAMTFPRPFTVVITPAKVTMLLEFQHTIRHVHLNEDFPSNDDIDPFFGGTSVGEWDGNALVVTTARFNDQIWLDSAGSPQSENSKITERFEVSADGNSMLSTITVEDPDNYTAPWSTQLAFVRSSAAMLQEDICAYKLMPESLRSRLASQNAG